MALLEEWRRNMEGFSDGLRTILQSDDDDRPPVIGVVSQVISAPAGFEVAIEAALGISSTRRSCPTRRDAHEAARWLRERKGGRATMLWLDETAEPTPPPEMPAPDGERFYGFAHDVVQCAPELRGTLA